MALPHFLGFAAAPGFLYTWSDLWRDRRLSTAVAIWMRLSLRTAILAGLLGTLLAIPLGAAIAAPFAAVSIWQCMVLLRHVDHFSNLATS
jgi:hypothetical protein